MTACFNTAIFITKRFCHFMLSALYILILLLLNTTVSAHPNHQNQIPADLITISLSPEQVEQLLALRQPIMHQSSIFGLTREERAAIFHSLGVFGGLEFAKNYPLSQLVWPLGISAFILAKPQYLNTALAWGALCLMLQSQRRDSVLQLLKYLPPKFAKLNALALKWAGEPPAGDLSTAQLFLIAYTGALTCEVTLGTSTNLLKWCLLQAKIAKKAWERYNENNSQDRIIATKNLNQLS